MRRVIRVLLILSTAGLTAAMMNGCLSTTGGTFAPGSGSASTNGSATTSSSSSLGQVQLEWSPSQQSPQGYYVQYSVNGANFVQIQTVYGTSATITGLSPGTYYFRVQAFNQGGASPYSSMVTATIP